MFDNITGIQWLLFCIWSMLLISVCFGIKALVKLLGDFLKEIFK